MGTHERNNQTTGISSLLVFHQAAAVAHYPMRASQTLSSSVCRLVKAQEVFI